MSNEDRPIDFSASERSETYRNFASCFTPPDKPEFPNSKRIKSFSELLAKFYPIINDACNRLQENFEKYETNELLVEYAKLFVGPFALLAPPYGSVYMEDGSRIMGVSTVAVMSYYKDA